MHDHVGRDLGDQLGHAAGVGDVVAEEAVAVAAATGARDSRLPA
jgi:hypothetical protein